jgi:iron complex transport system ATP-binding protein
VLLRGLTPLHEIHRGPGLHRLGGGARLVIAAIHDLTLAARSATHVMALHKGRLAAFGPTAEVLTPGLLRRVFDVEATVTGAGQRTVVDFLAPSV